MVASNTALLSTAWRLSPSGSLTVALTFEGPLDVLLRLIEKRELEISKVALAAVADQFLAYVHALAAPEPQLLAAFLSVAAPGSPLRRECERIRHPMDSESRRRQARREARGSELPFRLA